MIQMQLPLDQINERKERSFMCRMITSNRMEIYNKIFIKEKIKRKNFNLEIIIYMDW